ncbi:MAG: GNAT family N-acetyltransferase [Bacteroidota bacterium]
MYKEPREYWMITPVVRDKDFQDMKDLIIEFATAIDFELDYQQLLRESASIREIYKMPAGAGFLLKSNGQCIGFIGIKKLSFNTAEISKFYVRPTSAYLRWSVNLLDVAIDWAGQSNYKKIRVNPSEIHQALTGLFYGAGFLEKAVRDEKTSQLYKVLEKALVSIPEYFELKR